ncbi:MAG: DUF11 domain-containing protein [Planctomycetaceae bacterium]|jgi:uncharacterized repeat protein (TIGR01451 family)|nr:DUF11 domain-containing protein [Planctomycetaceae bacterium]
MKRYLAKLISVNFVAVFFAVLFGFLGSDLLVFAQKSEPLSIHVLSSESSNESSKDISPDVLSNWGGDNFFVILGQQRAATAKKPGLFERIRNTIWGEGFEEEEETDPSNMNASENSAGRAGNRPRQITPAQPIVPPKPVTVSKEPQHPEAPTTRDSSNESQNRTNISGSSILTTRSNSLPRGAYSNLNDDMEASENESKSSYERLRGLRREIFSRDGTLNDASSYPSNPMPSDPYVAPQPSRRHSPTYPDEFVQDDNYPNRGSAGGRLQDSTNPFARHDPWGYGDPNGQPYPNAQPQPEQYSDLPYEVTTRRLYGNGGSRQGTTATNNNSANNSADKNWNRPAVQPDPIASNHSPHVAQNLSNNTPTETRLASTIERQLTVSPLIQVVTDGDSRAIVGRETKYRVRVSNQGGATAERVVLTIEIPDWITFNLSEFSSGRTEIKKENSKSGSRDFVWNIGQIEPNKEELLELLLKPQERRMIDLKIQYDFYRPPITPKIVVEEAVLDMELQGPDEILWGTKVAYKLVVRNTGSGDAEKVKLELMETGSELKEFTFPLIEAGKEKSIMVDVYAGKLQRAVDINIRASSAYEVNAKVEKKVKILRPEVTMSVETREMQFVGTPAEFTVKIKNSGDAEAKNLELTVTIPIGAKYISSTNGGELTPQNQVRWSIDSLPINGDFVASIVCTPHREGVCKIDTILKDKEDSVAQCTTVITAEAIADLRMTVEPPNGPIEVGQEAVFVINVTNRGTKLAGNVALFVFCSSGLKPISTLGDKNRIGNGVVEFDVIPAISAGQTVVMKVITKAEQGGNHRIRAELMSPYTADVAAGKVEPLTKLLSEQTLSFYQGRGVVSTRQTQNTPDLQPAPPEPINTPEPPITDPFPQ